MNFLSKTHDGILEILSRINPSEKYAIYRKLEIVFKTNEII